MQQNATITAATWIRNNDMRPIRRDRGRPIHSMLVGYAFAIFLAVINAFVHSRDGYAAVVPSGLTLSASVVIVLLLAEIATILANRRRVGGQS